MKRRCLSLLSSSGCHAVRRCQPAQLAAFPQPQHPSATLHPAFSYVHTSASVSSDVSALAIDITPPLLPLPFHPPSSAPTRAFVPDHSSADAAAGEEFYTLGLDINTQSIGYVLLTPSLHTLRTGLITLSHLPPTSSPATRLHHVTQHLTSLLPLLPPQAQLHTAVESYLLSFSGRGFQTRHLFQLAAFNSQVQCQLWHLTGQRRWPAIVSVNSARSRFGLKGDVKDGKAGRRVSDVKAVVWRWVDERLRREGAAEVEWRRKRDGSIHATMYDISDAYLVALTAAMDRRQQHSTGVSVEEGSIAEEVVADSEVRASRKSRVRKVCAAPTVDNSISGSGSIVQSSSLKPKTRRRRTAAS